MRVQKISFTASPTIQRPTQSRENQTIERALEELKKINFDNNDMIYMRAVGANPPFKSGLEAYEFLKNNNVDIRFAKLAFEDAHAIWDYDERAILISERYRNLTNFPETLAIASAIFHEAGHAKDEDIDNSIQEELDCLSLNALGHRYYKKAYKDVFLGQNSFFFSQGVGLYEDLFYRFDTQKHALRDRVAEKYGYLQLSSNGHNAGNFAKEIKKQYKESPYLTGLSG